MPRRKRRAWPPGRVRVTSRGLRERQAYFRERERGREGGRERGIPTLRTTSMPGPSPCQARGPSAEEPGRGRPRRRRRACAGRARGGGGRCFLLEKAQTQERHSEVRRNIPNPTVTQFAKSKHDEESRGKDFPAFEAAARISKNAVAHLCGVAIAGANGSPPSGKGLLEGASRASQSCVPTPSSRVQTPDHEAGEKQGKTRQIRRLPLV